MTTVSLDRLPSQKGSERSRREVTFGISLAMTAGLLAAMTPHKREATLGHTRVTDLIPNTVGSWTNAGADGFILPEDTTLDDVYDQVVTRVFVSPGQPSIMFLMAYGSAQSGMMKLHRPEVCYSAAGFGIYDSHPTEVTLGQGKTIAAREFLGRREDRSERVLYWTRISNKFPVNLTEQRLIMIERGMQGIIPDGVLVRISTLAPTAALASQAMQSFASALYVNANNTLKLLLVGEN